MKKDVIFDIDGTLADANHRIHFIKDPSRWVGVPPRPDWGGFLDNSLVSKDTYIPETWFLMDLLFEAGSRILFITGRPESQREMTWKWLSSFRPHLDHNYNRLYMRKTGDHRPSDIVKGELLDRAIADGFDPKMVFEDRIQDTAMWRSKGLRCFQVAEGDY